MFNRFYEFSNLDLFSCQDIEAPGSLSPDFTKPAQRTTLPQGDNQLDHEFFYQKSTQNLTNGYEISFENNFMKEHQAAFEKELQNCMESFRIHQNKTGNSLNLENLFITHTKNCQQLLQQGQFSVLGEKTLTFLGQLCEYDKLSEFLDIVLSKTPQFIANELVGLASTLVDKYEQLKFQDPTDTELLKVASDVSKSLSFERLIAVKGISLAKTKETSELKEKTTRFLEVYCGTTMLVIAQYFENPFTDDGCGGLKRSLSPWSMDSSEDEGSCEPSPSKKRKFSY